MRALRVAVSTALIAACATAFIAVRAYRLEATVFSPSHDIATTPAWATALTLHGDVKAWFAAPKNGRVIVLAHGSPSTRSDLLPEAQALVDHGFGVVLFDFPGHGETPGTVTWGAPDRAALDAAVDFAVGHGHVGVLGFSMGSCISAQVAAEDKRIEAVVLEGTFTNMRDQLRYEFRRYGPLSQYPALLSAKTGLEVDHMRPIDVIERLSGRPLLLIAGTADPTVPPAMSEELYARAGQPKTLWLIEGARHGHYESAAGHEYFERLAAFFTSSLQVSGQSASTGAP